MENNKKKTKIYSLLIKTYIGNEKGKIKSLNISIRELSIYLIEKPNGLLKWIEDIKSSLQRD